MSDPGPTVGDVSETRYVQGSFEELGEPLRETTFVVVDLETTGGTADGAGITEIGAVKVRGGENLGEFSTLVNPGTGIPPFIAVLTGITNAMVYEAPRIESVLPSFLEFAKGTVQLAQRVLIRDEVPNCKLATLSRYFRTPNEPCHRALADARATADVLHCLIGRVGNQSVHTLPDLIECSRAVSPAQRSKRHLADGIPAVR